MIKDQTVETSGHPRRWIKPNVDFGDVLNTPEVPIQRNQSLREKRMSKIFAEKDTAAMHDFTIFNVVKDILLKLHNEEIFVPVGEYLGDGNTRVLSNKMLTSKQRDKGYTPPEDGVNILGVDIHTEEQLQDEYFGVDSVEATESKANKIQGAIKNIGIDVKSTTAIKGGFASALDKAYPGDNKDKPLEKVAYFKNEIQMLDECGVFNPTEDDMKNQGIMCASLIAAKLYSIPDSNNQKIRRVLESMSRLDVDSLKVSDRKWNGVTCMIHQMVRPNEKGEWYPMEHHKSTKGAAWAHHQGFLLYCFELQMTDKLISKKGGFKPKSQWLNTDTGYTRYMETLETLEQLYPTS